MTNNEVQQLMNKVAMLQYVGCRDISTVMVKMHFWDFVGSLTTGYMQYGSLTDKQKAALVKQIEKHTGVECRTCEEEVITHIAQYEAEAAKRIAVKAKAVQHNFEELHTIQLYDLPLESGSTYTMVFHPYNKHSLVVLRKGHYYKIPHPDKWDTIEKDTKVEFTYKRTEMKGFMTKTSLS